MPKENKTFRYFTSGPSKTNEIKQEIVKDYFRLDWRLKKTEDDKRQNYYLVGPSGMRYLVSGKDLDFFYYPGQVEADSYSEFDEEYETYSNFPEINEASVLGRILRTIPKANVDCLVELCNSFKFEERK